MKQCALCKTMKDELAFHVLRSSPDGRQPRCKECVKVRHRETYCSASETASTKARQAVGRAAVQPHKSGPCVDCGQTYHPFVMDFDHVRGVKVRSVSQLVARCASPAKLLAEIAKCDLVCSNCHRIRTWNRNNPTDPIGCKVSA